MLAVGWTSRIKAEIPLLGCMMDIWTSCENIAKQEIQRLLQRGFHSTIWDKEDLLQEAGVVYAKVLKYYPQIQRDEVLKVFRVSFRNRLIDIGRRVNREKGFMSVARGNNDLTSETEAGLLRKMHSFWGRDLVVYPGQGNYVILKEEKDGKE